MSLLVFVPLLVDVDQSELVFLDITRASDTHGCQGDFLLIFFVLGLLVSFLFDSSLMLCLLDLNTLLQRVTIDHILQLPCVCKPLLLCLKVVLVHLSQVAGFIFLLQLFLLKVLFVVLHLRDKQLLSFDTLYLLHVFFATLLVRYGVNTGCFFLHALQSLLVLCVSLITSDLVYEVLYSLLLESLLSLCFLLSTCLHVQLLVQVCSLHICLALQLRGFV